MFDVVVLFTLFSFPIFVFIGFVSIIIFILLNKKEKE